MGLLADGKWQDVWYDTASSGGRLTRIVPVGRARILRNLMAARR